MTGGKPAYSGGELWFIGPKQIFLNGCSGRYGPKNSAELNAVVNLFLESGFDVMCPGWDKDTNKPQKYW